MNTQEGVELAQGGFKIFLTIFVISVTLGLVTLLYNQTNDAAETLHEHKDELQNSVYSPYDNKIIKGDLLLRAIHTLKEHDAAILIMDRNFTTESPTMQGATTVAVTTRSDVLSGNPLFYNIGTFALLSKNSEQFDFTGSSGSNFNIYREGYNYPWTLLQDFGVDREINGGALNSEWKNNNVTPLYQDGSNYQIDPSGSYYVELLHDPTSSYIAGIVVTPM